MHAEVSASPQPATAGSDRRRLLRWAGWFLAVNAVPFWAVSVIYLVMGGAPSTLSTGAFLGVTWLGHYPLLALAPLPLLALAIGLWPRRPWVFTAGVLLATLALLVLVIDALVFRLWRFHLNGMVWSLITQGGMFEILPVSRGTWVGVGLLVLGLVVVEAGLAWAAWAWVRVPQRRGFRLAVALLGLWCAGQVWYAAADALGNTAVTRYSRFLPAYRPLTVKRTLRNWGWIRGSGGEALRLPGGHSQLRYPLEPLQTEPPPAPLNVVILALDSWRADTLTPEVTPHIARFAERCVRFTQHSAVANATRYGVFCLFYGLYGTYWPAMLAEQRGPVLLQELNRAGYQFGIFGSARLTSPEFHRTVFAEIRERIPLRTDGETVIDRDREITRRFLEFLDQRPREKPFFGFVFYDAPHAYEFPESGPAPFQPCAPSVQHLTLNRNTDPVPIFNRYRNSVHFVDGLVSQILARLEAEGLLERTVVVLTADHGEEFNDTGGNYWGHNSNFFRPQTHVPFVVWWPGRPPAVVDYRTSHLDLAPTLLRELLRCRQAPDRFCNGLSLFDAAPRVPLLAANWNHVALLGPGRVDEMSDIGTSDHYDEAGREITSPLPPGWLATAIEGMNRFLAR